MLSPSQQSRLKQLENTRRTPVEDEEYQILKSHEKEMPRKGVSGDENAKI